MELLTLMTMAFLGLERPPWAWILLLSYGILLFHSLWKSSLPSITCSEHQSCLYPLINSGDTLSLELWLFSSSSNTTQPRWNQVETCTLNMTLPPTGILPRDLTSATENCTVGLPPESRIRWSDDNTQQKGGPLRAKFVFRQFDKDSDSHLMGRSPAVAEIPFELTRIVERTSFSSLFSDSNTASRRNLLNEPSKTDSQTANKASETNHKFIPYLKYGSQPIVLRFVAETRPFGGPPFIRNDGIQVIPWNQTAYRPLIYIDENALERSRQQEIAPPEQAQEKPPVTLRIEISSISPIRDVINQQVTMALDMAESMLSGSELDEFRYFLRDERLYRFLLTQVISFLHVWVDYLAFRDEVRFYKSKTNFAGISVSSVLTRLVCSIIIFLYLLDGGGTSWVVLISVLSGISVDAWKAIKLLRPQVVTSWPFVKFRVVYNSKEQATAEYDRIAMKYLAMFLYPLVIGWSIYALKVSMQTP